MVKAKNKIIKKGKEEGMVTLKKRFGGRKGDVGKT